MTRNVGNVEVDMKCVTGRLLLNVKVLGGRRCRWRLFIVDKLLALANLISPMGIEVEITDKVEP